MASASGRWFDLSAPPIVVGRSRRSRSSAVLPYALAATVAVGLCSFLFVSGPVPPERAPQAGPAIVQQPMGSASPQSAMVTTAAPRVEVKVPPTLKPASASAPAPLSSEEVREIQARLQSLRLDPGPVDGVAGSRTTDAIQRYQARKGQTQSGSLDRELLDSLRNDEQAQR